MANHEIALNALFNTGLRQRELEIVLASNCVLDWFGRTVTGRAKVINYYLNSNNSYEHSMSSAETIDAFEERSTHMSTREQPLDNFVKSPDLFADNVQWYDCETHTPVDLKETLKTPPRTSITPTQIKCPPAPSRRSHLNHSDDEIVKHDSDSSDIEDGIQPLDKTFELKEPKETEEPTNIKRQRRDNYDDIAKKTKLVESIVEEESRYSGLHYIEVAGMVTIRRQATSSSRDECDRRECKMQISYRINKESTNDVQIALIVYKNLSSIVRSRRNLMMEFVDESVETQELPSTPIASSFSTPPPPPTSSRCRTVIKDRKQHNNNNDSLISTAPCAGEKVTKATKRPIASRNRLRF